MLYLDSFLYHRLLVLHPVEKEKHDAGRYLESLSKYHHKYFTLKLSVELSLGSFLQGTTCLLQSVK